MRACKSVLIDLSGTVHVGNELIGNAKEAIQRLRDAHIPFRFVTNTTKETKDLLLKRLESMNIDVHSSDVHTSLSTARQYVEKSMLRPYLLLHDDALPEFDGIDCDKPNAVVVGLANENFSYHRMNEAFRLVLDNAPLIAIHKARYYKMEKGLVLGPGPFVSALEYAAGSKAVVLGKPSKQFFLDAFVGLDCNEQSTRFFIGDDVFDDIDGAQKAGLLGILVRTGKYRAGDEHSIDPPPFKTVNTVSDAVNVVLEDASNT